MFFSFGHNFIRSIFSRCCDIVIMSVADTFEVNVGVFNKILIKSSSRPALCRQTYFLQKWTKCAAVKSRHVLTNTEIKFVNKHLHSRTDWELCFYSAATQNYRRWITVSKLFKSSIRLFAVPPV